MPGLDLYYAADPCYQHRMRGTLRSGYGLSPRYRSFVALESAVFSTHTGTDILLIAPVQQPFFTRYYHTQPERFHMLPPGIAKDRIAPANAAEIRADFRREFAIQCDEHVVLMVGTGFKRKGVDRMVRALASLPDEIRNKTRLMVLGEDDPRPYSRMAKSLGILERVSILGGREDVPRFLLGADLLAHPAYSENTGTVLLEALASGLPVLVTEVCGYAFHIAQAKAGQIISSPFQQEELNRRLHEMLTSRERDNWRANALHYAMTTDLYSMPDRVVQLIEAKGARKVCAAKT
jgi:UDP-glucose:(heptosyl)LPS alpha-1,3-glucosyltransferase